jgi:hypothetical protein
MNFTVSSSGDPHRDSCAWLDETDPPRKNTRAAGMIERNFIAVGAFPFVFRCHRRAGKPFLRSDFSTPAFPPLLLELSEPRSRSISYLSLAISRSGEVFARIALRFSLRVFGVKTYA